MGSITKWLINPVGSLIGGVTSKLMGGSFDKGASKGQFFGISGGIHQAAQEKNRATKVAAAAAATEQRGKVLSSAITTTSTSADAQRLNMTEGDGLGSQLQEGDFRNKRKIFGN